MGEVKVESHNMGPTFSRLTSLASMWIGHPIPELRLFQNLTLKIKGQGHGWGHSSKSQCGSNILSTHIPFIPCQTGIPFLSYDFFENLTLKIKGQDHGWGHSSKSQCGSNILSIHIPFVPCQSALPFLRYSNLKIWPCKSRVKVKWPWCCTTTGLDNSDIWQSLSLRDWRWKSVVTLRWMGATFSGSGLAPTEYRQRHPVCTGYLAVNDNAIWMREIYIVTL